MFSKVKVYSSPISVGSFPASTKKLSLGATFAYATGTAPNVSLMVSLTFR